jgi:hypothetical protein
MLKLIASLMSAGVFVPLTVKGVDPNNNIFFLSHPYFIIWLMCFAWWSYFIFSVVGRAIKSKRVQHGN